MAFQRSCREILRTAHGFKRASRYGGEPADWQAVCQTALTTPAAQAAAYFEKSFNAYRVTDPGRPQGLFTGYFEPEYRGSRTPSRDFSVPVYGKPDDLVAFDASAEARTGLRYGRLVNGRPTPYPTRREIEAGALAGRHLEIAWLASPVDAYFMQVQGSARLRLPDGSLMRLAFAAKSGRPYTSIGRLLAERAHIPREQIGMDTIREWMAAHPVEARALMAENESFVFVREIPLGDPDLGPPGGERVGLTPGVSLAVDRRYWTYGTPVWLDTRVPDAGDGKPLRRLMIAQDTGSAIRGGARGDIFFGSGHAAGVPAGHMQARVNMIVLLPRTLAVRLGLAAQ
jgi:membrane-bound lytic murein transglycosylase A